jgi:hypothetical protein
MLTWLSHSACPEARVQPPASGGAGFSAGSRQIEGPPCREPDAWFVWKFWRDGLIFFSRLRLRVIGHALLIIVAGWYGFGLLTVTVLFGLNLRDRLRSQGRSPQNETTSAERPERVEPAAAQAEGAFAEAEHAAAA